MFFLINKITHQPKFRYKNRFLKKVEKSFDNQKNFYTMRALPQEKFKQA